MPNPIKIKSIVESIQNHGDHVYSVVFRTRDRFPRFKPGQFLHLSIDPFDPSFGYWPESRVFSIASNSGNSFIKIIYSVKGKYTQRMESYLAAGSEVWLKFPYGDFMIDLKARKDQNIVLIAGGTGITPFIPYLEGEACIPHTTRKILLFYGVRKHSLLLIEDLLSECIQKLPHFFLELYLENSANDNVLKLKVPTYNGILDTKHILNKVKEIDDPVIFISGPPVMIKSFKDFLVPAGISVDNIKTDEWE